MLTRGKGANWVAFPGDDSLIITKTQRNSQGEDVVYEGRKLVPLFNVNKWEWYEMPNNVYIPKEYPKCKCGRRYVPIKTSRGLTRRCYWCRRWKDNKTDI